MCLNTKVELKPVLEKLPDEFFCYKMVRPSGNDLVGPCYSHKKYHAGVMKASGKSRGNGDSGIYVFWVDPGNTAVHELMALGAGDDRMLRMKVKKTQVVAAGTDSWGKYSGFCLVVRELEITVEDFNAAKSGKIQKYIVEQIKKRAKKIVKAVKANRKTAKAKRKATTTKAKAKKETVRKKAKANAKSAKSRTPTSKPVRAKAKKQSKSAAKSLVKSTKKKSKSKTATRKSKAAALVKKAKKKSEPVTGSGPYAGRSVKQLKALAKKQGWTGYGSYTQSELVKLVRS